jgi:hypothetical protein
MTEIEIGPNLMGEEREILYLVVLETLVVNV